MNRQLGSRKSNGSSLNHRSTDHIIKNIGIDKSKVAKVMRSSSKL